MTTNAIDFGNNAVWGADWKRARECGNDSLSLRYEQIMQAQQQNDPVELQTAIRTQMISAGHDVALDRTTRQNMLAAVQAGRSYTAPVAVDDALSASLGWKSKAEVLTPQQTAGRLLHDQWLCSDHRLSLADLWRANHQGSSKA